MGGLVSGLLSYSYQQLVLMSPFYHGDFAVAKIQLLGNLHRHQLNYEQLLRARQSSSVGFQGISLRHDR